MLIFLNTQTTYQTIVTVNMFLIIMAEPCFNLLGSDLFYFCDIFSTEDSEI